MSVNPHYDVGLKGSSPSPARNRAQPRGTKSHAGEFATSFKRLVVPRLEQLMRVQAFFLAGEIEGVSWSSAVDVVWDQATRLGAHDLPPEILDDLQEWINCSLLDELTLAEKRVEQLRKEIEQRQKHEPAAYWRDLVEGSRPENRKAIQHVAIALSPHYRLRWASTQGPGVVQRRAARLLPPLR